MGWDDRGTREALTISKLGVEKAERRGDCNRMTETICWDGLSMLNDSGGDMDGKWILVTSRWKRSAAGLESPVMRRREER